MLAASVDMYRYAFVPSVEAAACRTIVSVSSQKPENSTDTSGKPWT